MTVPVDALRLIPTDASYWVPTLVKKLLRMMLPLILSRVSVVLSFKVTSMLIALLEMPLKTLPITSLSCVAESRPRAEPLYDGNYFAQSESSLPRSCK